LLLSGIVFLVLVEYVPTFSPGLNFPRAHCYNTRQCTAAVAVMPLVIKLLLLGEGIVAKVYKTKRTDRDRKTDRQTVAAAGVTYYVAWTNATDLFLFKSNQINLRYLMLKSTTTAKVVYRKLLGGQCYTS